MWLPWSRVTDTRLVGNFEIEGGAKSDKYTSEEVAVRLSKIVLQEC
jgi:hypothetical protein